MVDVWAESVSVEPHPKFTGVGAVDQKPGLQLGMKRVVGEGDDVLKLLPRVLLGLVHQLRLDGQPLQQSWSKQTIPSRVLKPSCRAFKMQTRFSFWR